MMSAFLACKKAATLPRLDLTFVTLAIAEGESVKIEAVACRAIAAAVVESMPPLSRITAFVAAMDPRSRNLGSFHRITFFVPADDAFVKHFHVAIAVFIENAIGQTGQVMGAGSIENNWPVARNAL